MHDGPFNAQLSNKTQLEGEYYYVFTFTSVGEQAADTPPSFRCSHMCGVHISHVPLKGVLSQALLPRYCLTRQILHCITPDALIL